ncbi:MAG: hypothetical protein VX341_08470 [Bdellovibrionota bacterium]|nr:hypothetical protein [Bdellovibrionota bacterium]
MKSFKKSVGYVMTLLSLCTPLTSCKTDPLQEYIDSKWKPMTETELREESIKNSVSIVKKLSSPNFVFSVKTQAIDKVVKESKFENLNLENTRVVGNKQLLTLKTTIKNKFPISDKNEKFVDLNADLDFSLSLQASTHEDNTNLSNEISLKVIPRLNKIKINDLSYEGNLSLHEASLKFITNQVNKYANNISGVIAKNNFTKIEVPLQSIDFKKPVKSTNDGIEVNFEGENVVLPLKTVGVSWLIKENEIIGLTQLSTETYEESTFEDETIEDFGDLENLFERILQDNFDITLNREEDIWFAIGKGFLANTINQTFKKASLCAKVDDNLPRSEFGDKISISDHVPNCTPTRDCTPTRNCSFHKNKDSRNCSACMVRNPFGGCIIRGNDPICEAAKAAQNAAYEADYALKKADCERIKTLEKQACELEKAGEKALCETGKAFILATKDIGNYNGSVTGDLDMKACVKNFYVNESFDNIDINLNVNGRADTEVAVSFTPTGLSGHALCQSSFDERQRFIANINNYSLKTKSSIKLEDSKLVLDIESAKVPYTISPSPLEFLYTSPAMTIACQGLNILKQIALPLIVLNDFSSGDDNLDGKYEEDIDFESVTVDIKMPTQKFANSELEANDTLETEKAYIFSNTIK